MSDLVDEVRTLHRIPPPWQRKAIREAAGVSQQRVADELGVARPTVARWEIGERRPRGEMGARYAALLDELREATS